tara:strand:+ start:180 stop:341 length:162 start_codon:yes stop_codon:yes gene_type:complete
MLTASSAVQQASFSRLLLNKPIQYSPFTAQKAYWNEREGQTGNLVQPKFALNT